ncbi:MAG: autotransporter domain-containing protein, partial [Alphaproteobacteria bacterium]|nr:autotransporter domain-containing protein [Alphaproteobacteria bacterium]
MSPPPDWDEANDPPFIPDGEEWLVILHIDGARNGNGAYKDLVTVPGFYRTFTNTDWNTWKRFTVTRLSDEDWAAKGGGPRATSVIFDHEIVDHENNCPVHDSGPLTVNLGDGNGNEGNGNEGSGNEGNGNEGNGNNEDPSISNDGGPDRAWANRAILPEMGRALAFSAARCRIEQMFSDIARGWSKPSNAQLLPPAFAGRGAQRARTLGLKQAFGNASYLLPLAGGDGRDARFAAWACSDYRRLDGSDKGGTALWDGDVFNMQFGAETRLRPNMLAGVAVSRAENEIDYTIAGENGLGGTYDLRMTGVHPYFGLKPSSQLEIWGTAGFGTGTLRVSNSAGANYSGDARLATSAFGVNSRMLERGSTTLTVKGELGLANLDVSSASRTFAKAAADLQRFRLAAEIDHEKTVP